MTEKDVYYKEPQIFEFPNMTIRVYRPVLTEQERARRMREIEKAAVELVLSSRKGAKRA